MPARRTPQPGPRRGGPGRHSAGTPRRPRPAAVAPAPLGRHGPLRIAIDGPAGSGKSTVAHRLATALGLPYVNTGVMYRALADRALRAGADLEDGLGLAGLARAIRFELSEPGESGGDPAHILVDGAPPRPELRSPEVEAIVSRTSRHPDVRLVLRERQRELAEDGAVMEGRDIGSVVLPDADLKVFLTATLDARADRRTADRPDGITDAPGGTAAELDVERAVRDRDRQDARTNPLEAAPDAVEVDSTHLSVDEVVDLVLALVRERAAPPTPTPRVAVIGRQNVGKSTLLNRLVGRNVAISHETPGVTRDRLEVDVRWDDRAFTVIDTGGFTRDAEGIERSVARQADRAADAAALILLVVDATAGIQEEDAMLAARLRRTDRPVLVVANKVDGESQEPYAAEFHALGLGEPFPVSALHGRGAGDLLDRILDLLPRGDEPRPEDEARFALVGRPNVGKSSLFNRLVDDERAVVHEAAGTTRDAIDSVVEVEGRTIRFIDTAGFRRRSKAEGVEFYGLVRSMRAIDRCHVALLVVDASQGLTGEDKRVAARVVEAGRGLAVVLNKWDLVDAEERDAWFKELHAELALFPGTPVLPVSAVRGTGVRRIVPALFGVHDNWVRRVPTAEVNRVLERLLAAHPLPRGTGRIRYGTQVSAGPPTFVLFGARDPGPSYRRYLENALRKEFGMDGVPLRLSFRPKPPRGTRR